MKTELANEAPPITQLAFEESDFPKAEKIAQSLGYSQTAYTSTSALWGLYCLPENPRTAKPGEATKGGCIIKTAQFGFLFVQDMEDLGLTEYTPRASNNPSESP